jgi:hypothetical protein
VPDSAQVINLKASRDRADEMLIGPAVSKDHLPGPAADPELDIASHRMAVGRPEPAAIRALIHAGQDAFFVAAVNALAD